MDNFDYPTTSLVIGRIYIYIYRETSYYSGELDAVHRESR